MEEFKENLFSWYNFKAGANILDFGNNISKYIKNQNIDIEPKASQKYDYVILVGVLEKANKEENFRKAVSYLKEDGKLLIAENNKFGIKNWNGKRDLTGSLDYREITRTYNSNEAGLLSKNEIKQLLLKENIKNYKFYYLFPDYNLPNLIVTDEYRLTEEDISRNFESYEEGELVNFNENLALTEIVKEDPEQVKFFVNSFLIEASKKEIENNIKYISFTNYRKKEYRISTILTDDYAIKKSASIDADKHIQNISENLKFFPKEQAKVIEVFEDGNLKSKFIKENLRLDLEFQKISNYDEFLLEFNKYKNVVYQNVLEYNEIKDKLPEELKTYNLLSKMKFQEHSFIDMLPKNCFKVNDEYLFFDQEWCENYYPVEYIIYRAIKNTAGISERFGEDRIFKDLEIDEYIDSGFKSIAIIGKDINECKNIKKKIEKYNKNVKLIQSKDSEYNAGISIVPSYLAKGLEFDSVILFNVNSEKYKNNVLDIKLLYVAITRAMSKLDAFYTEKISEILN